MITNNYSVFNQFKAYENPQTSQKKIADKINVSTATNNYLKNKNITKENLSKAAASIGFLAGAAAIATAIYKRKNIKALFNKISGEVIFNSKQRKLIETEMFSFPKDINYRKNILNQIGNLFGYDKNDYAVLRPIIGKEELSSIIKEARGDEKFYKQGKRLQKWVQDTESAENIDKLLYRANLHIHTTASDGKLNVQELLDDAAEYADKIAASLSEKSLCKKAPYTIAICDHDSIEGCKEAVKIIMKNPKKYKNLRIVLGSELSCYHKGIDEISDSHRTHLLTYCHNPFDSELAKMLDDKKTATYSAANQIINSVQEKFKSFLDYRKINYNLEEAKTTNWCIKNGQNAVNNPLKDYFQFRIIFHEMVPQNEKLKKFLNEKNIRFEDLQFKDSSQNVTYIHKKLTQGKNIQYWENYIISLKWELLKKLHGDNFMLTPDNYKNSLKEVDELFNDLPREVKKALQEIDSFVGGLKVKETDQIFEFTQTINQLSKDNQIAMGIAHPAMSVKEHYKTPSPNLKDRENFIAKLFSDFKTNGKTNALFFEDSYPYFNNGQYLDIDDSFLEFIRKEALSKGLSPTGSLDNHGKNLFYTEKLDKFIFKNQAK